MLPVLNRRRVVPLYREVDAQRLSESRPAYNSVRLGLLTILALHYKFHHNGGLSLRALSHLRVLSPLLTRRPQAWYWASRDDHYEYPAPPGRVTLMVISSTPAGIDRSLGFNNA